MYSFEERNVKLKKSDKSIVEAIIKYCDNLLDDSMDCLVELCAQDIKLSAKGENFFNCLLQIRRELEQKGIQIMCNGAARNVYPSGMCLDMGSGLKAYKMKLGDRGSLSDLIEIFEYDDWLEFVSIKEQEEFYKECLKSHEH